MILKRTCLITSLLVFAATLFNGCGDPDKNKLIFKPEIGQTQSVNLKSATSTSMKAGPMDMTFGQSGDVTLLMTPSSVDEAGVVTVDVVYDYVDMEINGLDALPGIGQLPGMDDSIKALKEAFKGLKGESFTIKVARNGGILSVDGADAGADKVASALNTNNNPLMGNAGEQIRDSLNDEGMLRDLGQVFVSAPDAKLKPGDTWQAPYSTTTMMGDMQVDRTFTVGELLENSVKTTTVLQTKIDPNGNPMLGDAESSSGSGSGTATYDLSTGWPSEIVETSKISNEIKGPMGSATLDLSFKTEIRTYPK